MSTTTPLTRFQAAGIHLAISAAIAIGVLSVMLALWYPPPLFDAMGGKELAILLGGVDVVIGPMVTLIIYAHGKKSLRFDLATIAALQLAALAYGVHAMYLGRPVFIAFVETRFVVVSAAELEADALAKASPEFRTLPKTGPRLVAVDQPTDPKEQTDLLFAGLGGFGAQHLPQYYVPYDDRLDRVVAVARPLAQAKNLAASELAALSAAIERSGRTTSELGFLPVKTRQGVLTALVDAKSGRLVEIMPINAARP